jgi:hydroxymethylbilane synthase
VLISSEGDQDLTTPLYEMGVQGIFTKTLDAALLNGRIDIAVHSMKDVPTHLPAGIVQAAVLERGKFTDLFVFHPGKQIRLAAHEDLVFDGFKSTLSNNDEEALDLDQSQYLIATSSVRRRAQWLQRYPRHRVTDMRGNMQTRLNKLSDSDWDGAIFATAGLERINLRPAHSIELSWMLPAPAQGAIMVVCREGDDALKDICGKLNHEPTALCTSIEREFLRHLQGGCTTPISALAQYDKKDIYFRGNILSLDGKQKVEIEKYIPIKESAGFGLRMASQLLDGGGKEIAEKIQHAK